MWHFFRQISRRPKQVREQYAFVIAFFLTGLIALVFFSLSPFSITDKTDRVAKDDLRQIDSGLSRGLKDIQKTLSERFGQIFTSNIDYEFQEQVGETLSPSSTSPTSDPEPNSVETDLMTISGSATSTITNGENSASGTESGPAESNPLTERESD